MERRLLNEISEFCFSYVENDKCWIISDNYNLLIQIDINDNMVEKIIKIPGNRFKIARPYWKHTKIDNKIIMLPCNQDMLSIYNIQNQKFNQIKLDKHLINSFMSCIQDGNLLYLIDATYIFVFNPKLEKIINTIKIPYSKKIVSNVLGCHNGHIFITLLDENLIIDFSIYNLQFSYINIESKTEGVLAGIQDNNYLWLAGKNGNILKWNMINKECILFTEFPKEFETFDYNCDGSFIPLTSGWQKGIANKYWLDSFKIDNKIWFIPFLSNGLIYIDIKDNHIYSYVFDKEEETEGSMRTHSCAKFMFLGIAENRYIKIYSIKRNLIYCIDITDYKYEEYRLNSDNIALLQIKNDYMLAICDEACKKGITEKNNFILQDFISLEIERSNL